MIEMASAAAPDGSGPRRRQRGRWIAVSAAVVLVAGAVSAAVGASFHYLRAAALTSVGGGWLPPDNARSQFVEAGPYTALVTPPRPGHAQTFEVDVTNPSSVTQTVLGLTYDSRDSTEPDHLTVSAVSTASGDAMAVPYTSRPVAIPPNGVRTLRFTHETARGWGQCRSEYWTDLYLRVRVGWFTRNEVVSLGSTIFELRGRSKSCQ